MPDALLKVEPFDAPPAKEVKQQPVAFKEKYTNDFLLADDSIADQEKGKTRISVDAYAQSEAILALKDSIDKLVAHL